jgi:tRNA threonylcarbamoyladenosine biosynthesis protein TsaB
MPYILNIDTSTTLCSVCVAKDGIVTSSLDEQGTNLHAQVLTQMIADVLAMSHISPNKLAAIALSSGPGSYTGLRIGASVAKGLCYGLDIPLIAIPTHLGVAWMMRERVGPGNHLYVAMTDARRADAYLAIYDDMLNIVEKDHFVTLDIKLSDVLSVYISNKNIFFGGNATEKIKKCDFWEFGTIIENIPYKSINIASLSADKLQNGDLEQLMYYEPFYLKAFESVSGI